MPGPVDVALVSLGTTLGLRRADETFAAGLRAEGVSCEVRPVRIGRAGVLRRQLAVTDLVEAMAARRLPRGDARVTVFSTVTAALLRPGSGPYAVRFDSPAALNRRGVTGAWQRRAERRALGGARALFPWSDAAAEAAPGRAPRVVVPVPVEESGAGAERDIAALAYAGDPAKRGLDVLCRAWAAAETGARLVVSGIEEDRARAWLGRRRIEPPPGIEFIGPVERGRWLELVGRARLFLNASRWEDFGISQLEALSAGALLVTTPSPGPYAALPIARELAPALVDADLASAVAAGLALADADAAGYRERAAAALGPFRPTAVQRLMGERVVPALGFG
jgi:glycosyltransferase involved in cell wall biosynthesis